MEGQVHVYAVWSDQADRFYIGTTEDIEKRLAQHNAGLSKWTKRGIPWRLAWSRPFPTRTEALKFERLLKRQKGGAGFFRLTGLDPGAYR